MSKRSKIVNKYFVGRSVAKGVGFGRVLCLYGKGRQFFKSKINSEDRDAEIDRFRAALTLAQGQLSEIIADDVAGKNQSDIFETHRLFLSDRSLVAKIQSTITGEKVNSEWAVSSVIDEFATKYKRLSDPHLREKYIDLEDVGERLIAALGGERITELDRASGTVVAAREINPSTLIEIAAAKPAALVTERGGWTSHAFILARELGIPAVTGISNLQRIASTCTEILVDGDKGEIVIDPTAEFLENYNFGSNRDEAVISGSHRSGSPEVFTKDGVEITIYANLDLAADPDDLEEVKLLGIGLYRSEYLFNKSSGYPTEENQFTKYLEILKAASGKLVNIRTFDLGPGQIRGGHNRSEKNPSLGLRGIRLSLRNKDQFRVQIRALLKAGQGHDLGIVLPLVSDLSELIIARAILMEEAANLSSEKSKINIPRFGAMIEVPSAALMIDEIFKIVDFVNIGTNDLVQYLLAVDRDNDTVAENFRTLHPAVIKVLKMVFESSQTHNKTAIVCGEMAGSPLYVPLLIGLGARNLSMKSASVRTISEIVSRISVNEAFEIAQRVVASRTADEAEKLLKNFYNEYWPDIVELGF